MCVSCQLDNNFVARLFALAPHLTDLNMAQCEFVNDVSLRPVLVSLSSSLTDLNLSNCWKIKSAVNNRIRRCWKISGDVLTLILTRILMLVLMLLLRFPYGFLAFS